MTKIIQGDHGVTIPFQTGLNLTDVVKVTVAVKRGEDLLEKTATVLDPLKGACQFALSVLDLTIVGIYQYQYTVDYGTKLKSGPVVDFYVSEKLAGYPQDVSFALDGGEF
jgi:hypothetical protein